MHFFISGLAPSVEATARSRFVLSKLQRFMMIGEEAGWMRWIEPEFAGRFCADRRANPKLYGAATTKEQVNHGPLPASMYVLEENSHIKLVVSIHDMSRDVKCISSSNP